MKNKEDYYVTGREMGVDFRTKGGRLWKEKMTSPEITSLLRELERGDTYKVLKSWSGGNNSGPTYFCGEFVAKALGWYRNESEILINVAVSRLGIAPAVWGVTPDFGVMFSENLVESGYIEAEAAFDDYPERASEIFFAISQLFLNSIYCGFVHSDFHNGNVMCRVTRENVEVKLIDWEDFDLPENSPEETTLECMGDFLKTWVPRHLHKGVLEAMSDSHTFMEALGEYL